MIRLLAFSGVFALAFIGCDRSEPSVGPSPTTLVAEAPRTSPLDDELQQVLGCLKLVREEYRDAWRDGSIVDPMEYDETVMFLRRAREKTTAMRERLAAKGPDALRDLEALLAETDGLVAAKKDFAFVAAAVGKAVPLVESFLSTKIPPAVSGLVASVAKADAAAQAETLEDPYRIAVFTREPQTIHRRQADGRLKSDPADPGRGFYFGVLLRDRRTKRHLPHADVRVRFLSEAAVKTEARLAEIWGDYDQYGANVELPADGPLTVEVRVEPPDYNRHADMLAVFDRPVAATFEGVLEGKRRLTIRGAAPAPADADYALGDDLLQGIAESSVGGRIVVDAGPYRSGFIVEAPEPIWEWKGGKPELVPARDADTNHLEIVLMDRDQTRMVTGGRVALTLKDRATGRSQEVRLFPLLSVFFHYGATCEVPKADYDVTARIEPPGFDSLSPGLFEEPVEVMFRWDNRR